MDMRRDRKRCKLVYPRNANDWQLSLRFLQSSLLFLLSHLRFPQTPFTQGKKTLLGSYIVASRVFKQEHGYGMTLYNTGL